MKAGLLSLDKQPEADAIMGITYEGDLRGTEDENGDIVTNGGRVLGITATADTLKEARAKAYEATEWVQFENKYMRHDIGKAIDEV